MLRRFSGFLAAQIARPVGLLFQFAVLARALGPQAFGDFAQFYALAVVLSVISDFGQRQLAFTAVRQAAGADRGGAIHDAARMKLAGSLLLSLGLAGAALVGALAWTTAAMLAAVAITIPVADVSQAILRGAGRPIPEAISAIVEQLVLFLVLALAARTGQLTMVVALWAFAGVGAVRMALMALIRRRLVPTGPPVLAWSAEIRALIRQSAPTMVSLLVSGAVFRVPVLTFDHVLSPTAFAVFAAFWNLFLRGQLVVTALLQAGFRSGHRAWTSWFSKPHQLATASIALGVALMLLVIPVAQWLTVTYLGRAYADEYRIAILAAALQILVYPTFMLHNLLQLFRKPTIVTLTYGLTGAACLALSDVMQRVHLIAPVILYAAMLVVCGAVFFRHLRRQGQVA